MSRAWVKDTVERVVRTFLQAFASLVAADQFGLTDMAAYKVAVVSAGSAAFAAGMSAVGALRGDPTTGSLLTVPDLTPNC